MADSTQTPPSDPTAPPPPTVPKAPTSTRDTSLLEEAQARAAAPPSPPVVARPELADPEYVPTLEQWLGAGHSEEGYYKRYPKPATTPGWFCVEANHPGTSTPRADHFDLTRLFQYPGLGVPVCPLCKKPVSAMLVDDVSKIPPALQATKDRLEVAERNR